MKLDRGNLDQGAAIELFLSKMLESVPFTRHLGLSLVELGPHRAQVRIGCRGTTFNHLGMQHAGALFTLGETASGLAIARALFKRLDVIVPLVRSAEITYLRQTSRVVDASATLDIGAKALVAEFDSRGRIETPVAIDLCDARGRIVAQMTVRWVILARTTAANTVSAPRST